MVRSSVKNVENRAQIQAKRFPLNSIYFHRNICVEVIDIGNSKGA
jgi:hypothetical protein